MKLEQKNYQSGFTLIEVMVVMVILATIAVFVVPKFMDEPKRAQRVKACLLYTSPSPRDRS